METLPDELLLEVVNQVFLEGVHGVVNISLVNRRLHRLANDLIYSTFSLERGNPALFIRTLASCPIQARYVQEVDWDCRLNKEYYSYDITSDAFVFPGDLTPTELRNVRQVVVDFGTGPNSRESPDTDNSDTDSLNGLLKEVGTDVYLFVLLSFTPFISTVHIAIPSEWSCHAVWFWPTLALSNLRKATITSPMRIRNTVALFLLPSLRNLTLDCVVDNLNAWRTAPRDFEQEKHDAIIQKLSKEKSGIESFHVRNCHNDTLELAGLIRLFRRLEKLEIEFKNCAADSERAAIVDFLRAVTHHSSSLASLSIKDYRSGTISNILKVLGKLEHTSFLSLNVTETFQSSGNSKNVTCELLSRVLQQLPRCVQHLQLRANDTRENLGKRPSVAFCDALIEIAPTIKTILPALHTLAIIDWSPFEGTFTCQTKLIAILRAFAETGVRLQSQPSDLTGKCVRDLVIQEMEEEDWLWVTWSYM